MFPLRSMLQRYLVPFVLVFAGCSSPGCGAGAGQVVVRQEPAAVACLPVAITKVIACSAAHDHACTLAAVGELVVCWATHQPPAADPPPAPAPAESVVVAIDEHGQLRRADCDRPAPAPLGELGTELEHTLQPVNLALQTSADPTLDLELLRGRGRGRGDLAQPPLELEHLARLASEATVQLVGVGVGRRGLNRLDERDEQDLTLERACLGCKPDVERDLLAGTGHRHRVLPEVLREQHGALEHALTSNAHAA